MKYSLLNSFGSSYTWNNLDDEGYLNLQYIQICMAAAEKRQEMEQNKANFYSKEHLNG